MFPFSLGVLTLLQGLYSLCWFVILLDIGSPAFDLTNLPDWNAGQLILVIVAIATMATVVGVIMHTVSRNVFRRSKDFWALSSPLFLVYLLTSYCQKACTLRPGQIRAL